VITIEFKTGGAELAKVLHYYGVDDTSQGSIYKIVCPFHGDRNPSLIVNLEDGDFYCFGCGAAGNAVDFVKMSEEEPLNDLQLYIKYYKILKSKKVSHINIATIKKDVSKESNQYYDEAHDDYFGLRTVNWLKEKSPERKYMNKRGFTSKTLNQCKAKITYDKNYPIMFPMFDNGKFKGWDCRTTNKLVEKRRKYLYNKGFSRRNTLVGNYKCKTVVLVEGYMDLLKMQQNGLKHVAAVLGWKVTPEQITKLKEAGVEIIISALDNDKCGVDGSNYLTKFFKVIRFQYPTGVKDPGDLNKEAFDEAFEETKKLYKRSDFYHGISRRNETRSPKIRSKQR